MSGEGALEHFLDLGPGGLDEGLRLRFDDLAPLEEVGILQKVGFVGEDLLRAKRPLLVPGAR